MILLISYRYLQREYGSLFLGKIEMINFFILAIKRIIEMNSQINDLLNLLEIKTLLFY